jgi:inosose dehydratase
MHLQIANAPVSWGVDYAGDPANPPYERVLDEIAAAGFTHIELGPVGYLPEDPQQLNAELDARGLTAVGTFLFDYVHDPAQRARVETVAEQTCRLIAAAGGGHLVIVDHLAPERTAVAGRPEERRVLDATGFAHLIDGIRTVAAVAGKHGVRAVLHPHAGTYTEYRDEIDRVLAALDPGEVGLCIDTGHCAFAGIDPVALYRDYADRTEHFHFKDIDGAVLAQAIDERLDFDAAVSRGVFCPLGRGVVDWPGLRVALNDHDYEGTATIEQDVDPTLPADPVRDARASLAYLGSVGLVADGVTVGTEPEA